MRASFSCAEIYWKVECIALREMRAGAKRVHLILGIYIRTFVSMGGSGGDGTIASRKPRHK